MITVNQQIHKVVTWIKVILLILASYYLSACTTAGNAIPQGGPTMVQVYGDSMQQSDGDTLDQARAQVKSNIPVNNNENSLASFTRTQQGVSFV